MKTWLWQDLQEAWQRKAKIVLGHTLACWYIFISPYFLNNISLFILKIHVFHHTCNVRDVQWNRNQEDDDKSGETPQISPVFAL